MSWILPQDVRHILETLNKAGYSAYAVGGCVRDMFLERTPQDWDVTTAAPPEVILSVFSKTIPTGIKHGTVTVVLSGGQYEVTTFRVDGTYADHRKPESVTFTDDICADLSRRDFTMNAMAYHPEVGLVDPFGGREDIEKKLIRCVGDPLIRFDEDALRMLRALRFSAQTSFAIDEKILDAISALAPLLSAVSGERIRDELMKILLSDRLSVFDIMHQTGLLAVVLPEFDACFGVEQNIKYHIYDVAHHILKVTENVPKEPVLRLAALLHDVGKPEKKTTDENGVDHFKGHDKAGVALAEDVLSRLRFDNQTKEQVQKLISYHDRRPAETKSSVRRMVSSLGAELFPALLTIKRADTLGQNPSLLAERKAYLDNIEALYEEIMADGDALTVSDLAICGYDVMALGYQGKEIGAVLCKALEMVLENPTANRKEELLKFFKKID